MALVKDTEKTKRGNYRKTQSIDSLRRANNYVSRADKVGSVDINTIDNLMSKNNNEFFEELIIEELIDRKDKSVFNYVTKNSKTEVKLITGVNCRASSAFDEMMITKRRFNKTDGRQFKHFVHSYSKHERNLTPQLAHKITLELLEHEKFKGFEILVATHTDTDTLHSHILVNSVNMDTGLKWNHSLGDLIEITDFSNQLCEQHGLEFSFVDNRKSKFKENKRHFIEEIKAKEKGQSWKYEAFHAINDCRKTATSKEDFIEKLKTLGYKVRWVDNRKDIQFSFTTPDGKSRKLNADKLHPPENFTKEALLKKFALNKQYEGIRKQNVLEKQFDARQELVLQTIKKLEDDPMHHSKKDYPRQYLEGQALKEKMKERAKGEGLDWDKEQER